MVAGATALTRGPFLIRQQLIRHLSGRMPAALAAARVAWGLDTVALPDPVKYSPWEPLAIDERVPIVAVAVARARGFDRVDYEGEYQVRYFCTVYGWLKADEYGPPQDMRDDFASVLVSVLLDTPSLGGEGFRFEESTLEVNYSDAAKVKGDRWLAGVSLAFQVAHTEKLRKVPIGVVNVARLEVNLIGAALEHVVQTVTELGNLLVGHGYPDETLVWTVGEYYLDLDSGEIYRNGGHPL